MSVTLRLLFDEDTEMKFARLCERDGHDVQRVVEVPELGPGTKDPEVREYAKEMDRIIVTHDKGFAKADASTHAGVFYAPKQHRSSFRLYRILSAVREAYPSRDALQPVAHLTDDWL